MNKIFIVAGTRRLFEEMAVALETSPRDPRLTWIGPHNYPRRLRGTRNPVVLNVHEGMEHFPPDFYPTLRSREPQDVSPREVRQALRAPRSESDGRA